MSTVHNLLSNSIFKQKYYALFEKISFALIDKSFSFSPKKPFQILAERRGTRRETKLSRLQNS